MFRVIIKDRKGRITPVFTKVNRQSRIQPWVEDCKYCISYWKGENANARWAFKRWEKFSSIPWEDIEFEASKIVDAGPVY